MSIPVERVPRWNGNGDYSPQRAAEELLAATEGPVVLVAHSFQGLDAVAAASASDRVRGLVLAEPALYAIARGTPGVDEHIARMDRVFATDHDGPEAFWRDFVETISGRPFVGAFDEERLARARLQQRQGAPWWHPVDADALRRVPALVVTSGEFPDYEEIADALVALGAERVTLRGVGHRIPEHPDFDSVVREFAERIAS